MQARMGGRMVTGPLPCIKLGRIASLRGRTALRVNAFTTVPSEFKNVAPVGDRVFVKVDTSEGKTASGLLLPTSAQKKPTQGQIAKAGSAKAVKDGDTVVYSKYAGTELKLQGTDYVLLKEEDVIGVMPSKDIAQLKPLGDRILIEVEEAKAETAGGLLLAGGSKEEPTLGKVIAVGSGRGDDKGNVVKPNVEAGSTVLYQKYSGTEFEGEDERMFIVVRETDILASLA